MQERTAQSQQIAAGVREELLFCQDFLLESPVLWDTENPALYKAVTKIYKDGLLLDEVCTVTGFRNVRFDSTPVSYTHLDVYKRQILKRCLLPESWCR